jgi:hypothetical protein
MMGGMMRDPFAEEDSFETGSLLQIGGKVNRDANYEYSGGTGWKWHEEAGEVAL